MMRSQMPRQRCKLVSDVTESADFVRQSFIKYMQSLEFIMACLIIPSYQERWQSRLDFLAVKMPFADVEQILWKIKFCNYSCIQSHACRTWNSTRYEITLIVTCKFSTKQHQYGFKLLQNTISMQRLSHQLIIIIKVQMSKAPLESPGLVAMASAYSQALNQVRGVLEKH